MSIVTLQIYEVTIKSPTPPKPENIADRMWLANIERLGFAVGGNWVVGLRTIKAVWRIESDGRKLIDGFRYRTKDSSWAIEQALRWWRTEVRLLLGTEGYDWPYAVSASTKLIPATL